MDVATPGPDRKKGRTNDRKIKLNADVIQKRERHKENMYRKKAKRTSYMI